MFLNLPTLLTWARIVAIPLIVGVFYLPWPAAELNLTASVLFVLVALTDWFDGWLARRLRTRRPHSAPFWIRLLTNFWCALPC